MLSRKYQNEQIELEQQITNLREELSKMEQDMIGTEKWIELIKGVFRTKGTYSTVIKCNDRKNTHSRSNNE